MTLAEALKLFSEAVPGRLPIGYWERDGGYIFNTKGTNLDAGMPVPAQYVVTKDGKVYGTNPARSNLNISDMKKIRRLFKR